MAHEAKGSFVDGFAIKGFDERHDGDDIIDTFRSKESWVEDEDGEKYVTTPIQIDLDADRELKVCEDGELPDGYLGRDVNSAELTVNDFVNQIGRDEVKAGDPVDYVMHKRGAFLQTSLLDESDTPSEGDEVYVADGEYSSADPLTDEGEVVGEVVEDDTGDQPEGYVLIKLA
ncbi:MAG: hypothetical protein ACLFT4_06155 [Bacteroidales bacterium]